MERSRCGGSPRNHVSGRFATILTEKQLDYPVLYAFERGCPPHRPTSISEKRWDWGARTYRKHLADQRQDDIRHIGSKPFSATS